jgi:hypothetical protein
MLRIPIVIRIQPFTQYSTYQLGGAEVQVLGMHLQLVKWVCEKTGGSFLIICPLGVRQEFTQSDGPAMGMQLTFIRRTEEIHEPGIYVTNYESVRDGKLDVNAFQGVGMD